ncbi:MAG: protein kinase domain-containing protein [Gemmataceae bacterium]
MAGPSQTYPMNVPRTSLHLDGQGESLPQDITPLPSNLDTPAPNSTSVFDARALDGYKFLNSLGRGPLGELWNVRTPESGAGLARIVFNPHQRESPSSEALSCLENPGHPSLVSWRLVARQPERWTFAADITGATLQDRCQQCRDQGQPGVPRAELLDHLHGVAQAVDAFYERYAVPHVRLNPRSVCLQDDQVKVLDAGLVAAFAAWTGESYFGCNPRFAAPELADNCLNRTSDVYSLAIMYTELLTGCSPYRGQSPRQVLQARLKDRPDLTLLPAGVRGLVARALHVQPERRFSCCLDFISALEGRVKSDPIKVQPASLVLPSLITTHPDSAVWSVNSPLPAPQQFVADLVATAGVLEVHARPDIRCQLEPGEMLLYRCGARIVPELARLKVAGFCQRWRGQIVSTTADVMVIQINSGATWWQKFRNRLCGLKLELRMIRSPILESQLMEIVIRIYPFGCTRELADDLLGQFAPLLVCSLRDYLQAGAEQRNTERLYFPHQLRVTSVLADQSLGESFDCQGKDVSSTGMGFVADREMPTSRIYINPAVPNAAPRAAVLANIVRVHERGDGLFEMGVQFDLE